MPRVLVAGAGAIGQWLGARLLQAGRDVILLVRPAHHDAIRSAGLAVRGRTTLHGHVPTVTSLDGLEGGFDAVFLTAKAHATAHLAPRLPRLLAPRGVLATLQNGLGNAEKLCRFADADRVAVALTSHGVMLEAPGRIHHAGTGATTVGPAPAARSGEAARAAHALLADAGLEPEWQDAMRPHVWRKAIVNAGVNPVGAAHGATNGRILAEPALRSETEALVREAHAVALRHGVPLPSGDAVASTLQVLERTAANLNSMAQDVANRRPTELEQITGRILRLGRRLRVPVPRSAAWHGRIQAVEASYLGEAATRELEAEEMRWESDPF